MGDWNGQPSETRALLSGTRKIRASGDGATLEVRADIYGEPGRGPLDYRSETIARFELSYLPDTNEVVLLRYGNESEGAEAEAVYSELLDTERGTESCG